MFRSQKDYRTFLAILMTCTLDSVGFSIVFPVLAPLLLNTNLHFFAADTPVAVRTTVLGILFGTFGIAQFFSTAIIGGLADHYGRYKVLVGTIALSIVGYAIMAVSVYTESLAWMFVGRIVTGCCSGNFSLSQSVTADLTDKKNRSKAFGILTGIGGLGFVAGPWIGGKLANPEWIHASGAFIFAVVASIINLFVVLFFFEETWKPKAMHIGSNFLTTFKDMRIVFHDKTLRYILTAILVFSIGWAFYLIFSPTFLVQRFELGPDKIGDIFAYMSIVWFFVAMFLNKELIGKFSLANLCCIGMLLGAIGVGLFIAPSTLWPYWIVILIGLPGGALAWINLGALLSSKAPSHMQGRVLGVSGSLWSIGQIVAPLLAGPLAGWNLYSPLFVSSLIIFLAFLYSLFRFKKI